MNIMKIIYSRFTIKEPMNNGELRSCAVISFYTPNKLIPDRVMKVDYEGFCDRVFYVGVPDIDVEHLAEYGYTYNSYISDADKLAEFIYKAKSDNLNIVCQCEFGSRRSAACAAAILERFEGCGDKIFSDNEYCPNMLVYEKVLRALINFAVTQKR